MRIIHSGAVLTVSSRWRYQKKQHTPTQNPPPFPFPVSSYSAVLPITNKPYDTLYTTEYTVVPNPPIIHTIRYIVRGSRSFIEAKDQRRSKRTSDTPHHITLHQWIVGITSFVRTPTRASVWLTWILLLAC
jgi:hypothetical protein